MNDYMRGLNALVRVLEKMTEAERARALRHLWEMYPVRLEQQGPVTRPVPGEPRPVSGT